MTKLKDLKQNTGGFTLLELMVVILCASVITLAASGVLLFAMNSTTISADQAGQQNTARTVTMLLESLAEKGEIKYIASDYGSWALYRDDAIIYDMTEDKYRPMTAQEIMDNSIDPIMSYDPARAVICSGSDGSVLLDGVIASSISLKAGDDIQTGGLLAISIETTEDTYKTSIYSRTVKPYVDEIEENVISESVEEAIEPTDDPELVKKQRLAFTKAALGAYTKFASGEVTSADFNHAVSLNWDGEVPWCASIIAWLMKQSVVIEEGADPTMLGSNVTGYDVAGTALTTGYVKKYFESEEFKRIDKTDYASVQPGDLIFFDWANILGWRDGSVDHIGIVLFITETMIYTIEGNTAGTVNFRHYSVDSPDIMGFRVIHWSGYDPNWQPE